MGRSETQWADLIGEALADIFSRLSFEERIGVVPLVCKAWRKASMDPVWWQVVDMQPWLRRKAEQNYWWEYECEPKVNFLVQKVVDYSDGQLRDLRTMHCTDAAIEYLARRSPRLEVLFIPSSPLVTNNSALQLAALCPNLTQLDVSDCYSITMVGLEAFGRSCVALRWLGRNMLKQRSEAVNGPASPGGDDEAFVVSKHMGKLKHLEMKRTSLSDLGLEHLSRGCRQLENLNLACCTSLSPRALDNVSSRCTQLKNFTKPITPRMHVSVDFHGMLLE